MKLVVIGGNAAGMSAASRVRRRDPGWEVTVLEQTREVSYGACGLPYYVAGLHDELGLMRIRSAADFEKNGIRVKLESAARQVDPERKLVVYRDGTGTERTESYDKLLIASGSSPKIPDVPGIGKKGIYPLKTLKQARLLKRELEKRPRRVAIIGGGYIGLELAEACLAQRAAHICVIEAADQLLSSFDPEFGLAARQELKKHGVRVCTGEKLTALEGGESVRQVVTDRGSYDADLVILAVGTSPNTGFLGGAAKTLPNGAIVTTPAMETSVPDIYAAGDCASVWHRLLDRPVYAALGTNANKQGRLAGDSILGKPASFRRALGTAMLRCAGLELARTGLCEKECAAERIPYKTVTVQARSHARYYPEPAMLTIKLCYDPADHRLLGAQIMGEKEAAWRIDVFACAIDQGMTAEELGFLDLGYAPPFASVWDAAAVAANASK